MPEPALTAKAVFDRAHEIESPTERMAYLDEVCADAPALRERVEGLLRAYEEAGSFLDPPARPEPDTGVYQSAVNTPEPMPLADAETAAPSAPPHGPSAGEGPGPQIGPYRLVRELGSGGMGAVYLAEQDEPIRRQVALKIIKPGMDSAAVVARFQAERQALTLMDHANIARVYDADATPRGQPYLVMELVRGIPLTRFCDEQKLTVRARLVLFVTICQAVQHAHQKGIIHRDLKPSNVLVAMQEDRPVAKIIDFGLAKATDQLTGALTDQTQLTQTGAIVGTLQYMSPEQADVGVQGIDTRTDIYALGVMLYELLTGTTPLDLTASRRASFLEVVLRIREEEPPIPSTRATGLGERLAAIATSRRIVPVRLAKLLRGELDWIAMKAIEKDRNRRYDSASALAKDVERYLADEPVEASPPSVRYRLGKFIRRYRVAVAMVALFVGVLLLGMSGLTVGIILVNAARQDAQQREKDARAALHTTDAVIAALTKKGTKLGAFEKQILRNVAEENKRFLHPPGAGEEARLIAAETQLRQGNLCVMIGEDADAAAAYQEAMQLFDKLAADFPGKAEYRNELAATHFNVANLLNQANKQAQAEAAYRRAIELHQQLAAEFPANGQYRRDLADDHNNLGTVLRDRPALPEAQKEFREAIAILEKLVRDSPDVLDYRVSLARGHHNLGNAIRDGSGAEAALASYRKAIELLAPIEPAPDDAKLVLRNAHWDRANALGQLGRHTTAIKDWQRAIELDDGAARDHLRDFLAAAQMDDQLAGQMKPPGKLLYEAAGVHARATAAAAAENESGLQKQYADRALALLKQAQSAGWFKESERVRQLQADPRFDALTSDEFRAFIASVEAGKR
jgi:eukaryotic-like serine/threonine-protein kinase